MKQVIIITEHALSGQKTPIPLWEWLQSRTLAASKKTDILKLLKKAKVAWDELTSEAGKRVSVTFVLKRISHYKKIIKLEAKFKVSVENLEKALMEAADPQTRVVDLGDKLTTIISAGLAEDLQTALTMVNPQTEKGGSANA